MLLNQLTELKQFTNMKKLIVLFWSCLWIVQLSYSQRIYQDSLIVITQSDVTKINIVYSELDQCKELQESYIEEIELHKLNESISNRIVNDYTKINTLQKREINELNSQNENLEESNKIVTRKLNRQKKLKFIFLGVGFVVGVVIC